jgi:hypothetical protein
MTACTAHGRARVADGRDGEGEGQGVAGQVRR